MQARVLGDLGYRGGFVAGLSAAFAPLKLRCRRHDRGHVLTQVAVAIADGAPTLSDIAVLRHQPAFFGTVALCSVKAFWLWRWFGEGGLGILRRHGTVPVKRRPLTV